MIKNRILCWILAIKVPEKTYLQKFDPKIFSRQKFENPAAIDCPKTLEEAVENVILAIFRVEIGKIVSDFFVAKVPENTYLRAKIFKKIFFRRFIQQKIVLGCPYGPPRPPDTKNRHLEQTKKFSKKVGISRGG